MLVSRYLECVTFFQSLECLEDERAGLFLRKVLIVSTGDSRWNVSGAGRGEVYLLRVLDCVFLGQSLECLENGTV